MTEAVTDTIEAPATEAVAEAAPVAEAPVDIIGGAAPEAEGGDPAVEAPVVPEAYELTAPEGFEGLDAELVEAATPVFKELGLTNEQANKLLPLAPAIFAKAEAAFTARLTDAMLSQKSDWAKAAMADPQLGADWNGTLGLVAKGMDAAGFPEGHAFRTALAETGFGNHPDMIRLVRMVGELASEGAFVAGGAATAKIDPLKQLYPND
jgi:hypothetical protein